MHHAKILCIVYHLDTTCDLLLVITEGTTSSYVQLCPVMSVTHHVFELDSLYLTLLDIIDLFYWTLLDIVRNAII